MKMTLAWSAILPRAGPAQRPSAAVSKLERIGGGFGDDVVLHQPLEALHHDRSECDGAVIIEG